MKKHISKPNIYHFTFKCPENLSSPGVKNSLFFKVAVVVTVTPLSRDHT